ncbi:MAG: hypothetical protein ACLPX8_07685 [Bryobacteraceae bacterium]|jgi:hypothetical protein
MGGEMTDGPEVNDEYSRNVAELLRLIEQLPADRREQLGRELEAGKLDIEGLRRAAEDGGQ